uniref:Transposase n=1 Tax=Siphoviridae sp. ctWDo30 TaxID=2826360 RepID=A0A8S5N638_9CAUD|nr:MAG TPA: hypothetical protein [Siphoviridae sp. ctWDo30]
MYAFVLIVKNRTNVKYAKIVLLVRAKMRKTNAHVEALNRIIRI